jgi:hypothetical protein
VAVGDPQPIEIGLEGRVASTALTKDVDWRSLTDDMVLRRFTHSD